MTQKKKEKEIIIIIIKRNNKILQFAESKALLHAPTRRATKSLP